MAIVRITSFTKSKPRIKGTVRYITHRTGRDGEKMNRELFDFTGKSSKEIAYQLIDNAPSGTVFFRFAISPDPRREDKGRDLDLERLTRRTLRALEKKLQKQVKFFATMHDDHTQKRHIHAIVLAQARIDQPILAHLYETATQDAVRQRGQLDLLHRIQNNRQSLTRSFRLARSRGVGEKQLRGYRPMRVARPACLDCGRGQTMYRAQDGSFKCPNCNRVRERSLSMNL